MFSGLFFRDGRVIGLSRVYRSLCFPLGIGVETSVLEIASLDFGFGLIMGDFHDWFGHEGRPARQRAMNVASSSLHEGRGAGKTDPRGGHDLVNGKK